MQNSQLDHLIHVRFDTSWEAVQHILGSTDHTIPSTVPAQQWTNSTNLKIKNQSPYHKPFVAPEGKEKL